MRAHPSLPSLQLNMYWFSFSAQAKRFHGEDATETFIYQIIVFLSNHLFIYIFTFDKSLTNLIKSALDEVNKQTNKIEHY
jgi:hypothetical protein